MHYNRLMHIYNWQQSDWPHFRYDLSSLYEKLLSIAEKTGLIKGKISHLHENQQKEALLDLMIEEAIKTSEIEGEYINRIDVRSSIKNKLGMNPQPLKIRDKRAEGVVELMFNVHDTATHPLTEDILFNWHLMLLSGTFNPNLRVGYWRTEDEPMQIVSGPQGKVVHFEAPPAPRVPQEMEKFIAWFNDTASEGPIAIQFAPVRAAIAHLYFESIHPFDDGNGRIGRAIAEKALLQSLGYPAILSLSRAIDKNKKAYYAALHIASKSNEITPWLHYFIDVIIDALDETTRQINFILNKSLFWDKYKDILNTRQQKVIQRMLQEGLKGFEGGMHAKKYMTITGVSKATATRDLQELLSLQAFKQLGGGRNIRYELNF